jgi:hypothetical protein
MCGQCISTAKEIMPLMEVKKERCFELENGQFVVSYIDGSVIATYLPTCINARVVVIGL